MIRLYKEKHLVPEPNEPGWLDRGIRSQTLSLMIAPGDYVEQTSGRRYFSWTEIMELQSSGKLPAGWRLPTKEEYQDLINEFSTNPGDGLSPSSALIDRLSLMPNGWIIPERLHNYAEELELSDYATARGGTSGLCAYWTSTMDMNREEEYLIRGYRNSPQTFYAPSTSVQYAFILAATREGRLEVTQFPTNHGLTVRLVHEID